MITRKTTRTSRLATAGTCLLVALGIGHESAGSSPGAAVGGFTATAATGGGRLRVAAQPGDPGLANRSVTAIVRRADGSLVDFWTNKRTLPTAPQLKRVTDADGLWSLVPLVDDGRKARVVTYDDVRLVADTIRASADVEIAASVVHIETQYRLDDNHPTLFMSTRLSLKSGGQVHFKFQEALKWGNADYFVENVAEPLNNFDGTSSWIGRHGLCGDLKWTRIGPDPFQLEFRQAYPGLAPSIVATYALVVLKRGETPTFERKLSYETLPEPPRLPAPPEGKLRATITDEAGRALPAKLSFRGTGGTPDPDFGNDGDESGVSRFVWSGSGQFERPLNVGTYQVLATAGFERAAKSWKVTIEQGKTSEVAGTLPRVIETPGWISGDLHLHQVESVDADLAHQSRLIAVAAEGVELAAATDHYAVTDFAPAVAQLVATGQLARPLATIVGSEVSTVGRRFGHFNLFPMQVDDTVHYADTTPHKLFTEMRQVAPDAVIQVNHPRWPDIGYFQVHNMDPRTHQIPYKLRDEYDSDFDAIEVFNGLDAYSQPRIRLVLRDWIALLGRGHRYTATGNSDSHKLAFQDPGLPRNFIEHGESTNDAQDVYASETNIIQGIKHGHVFVSSGPIIDVHSGDKGIGDTVKSNGKPVVVDIRVRAAPWVDVSRVEVLVGPKAERLRYVPVPASEQIVRYHEQVRVPGYAKTFVIVVAVGKKPLENVYATGVQPLAFTNPIWIEP